MKIAVDIRGEEEYLHFIYETFKRITAQHPHDHFIFLFYKKVDPSFLFSHNILPLIVKEDWFLPLQQFRISSFLKTHEADVFITQKTIRTQVPQYLFAFDKTNITSLKRAALIFCDSMYSAKQIQDAFRIAKNKIEIVYAGVDEIYKPVSNEQKEIIRESVADGNEFFLVQVSSETSLVNVLKAFSVFKKMLKSNMHLVVSTGQTRDFSALLNLYKFKSEVTLLENTDLQKVPAIIASAYAFISINDYGGILKAMQCNVPVIANDSDVSIEIASDAALYIDENEHTDIADKMMLVYKDENVRYQLIEKGREQVKKFSWDKSAVSLWKCIEKACR